MLPHSYLFHLVRYLLVSNLLVWSYKTLFFSMNSVGDVLDISERVVRYIFFSGDNFRILKQNVFVFKAKPTLCFLFLQSPRQYEIIVGLKQLLAKFQFCTSCCVRRKILVFQKWATGCRYCPPRLLRYLFRNFFNCPYPTIVTTTTTYFRVSFAPSVVVTETPQEETVSLGNEKKNMICCF